MSQKALKATVKNATVRPFEFPAAISEVSYNFDPAEPWVNAIASPFVVLPNTIGDARSDVRHAFRIAIDPESLLRSGIGLSDVDLYVVVRDNFSKKIVRLKHASIADSLFFEFDVDRSQLEETSLVKRIEFEAMLVTNKATVVGGRKTRVGARLHKHVVSVSAESQGLAFNYSRTSAEQFVRQNLQPGTTFHAQVDDPGILVEACDDIANAFTVQVHEDAWQTLQEIRTGDAAGEALGSMFISNLLFDLISVARQDPRLSADKVQDGSVLDRIFAWLSSTTGASVQAIKNELWTDDGLLTIQSRIQEACKLTRAVKRAKLGGNTQ